MVHPNSGFYNEMWDQWQDDLLIRHLDLQSCYDKTKYNARSFDMFRTVLIYNHSWESWGITIRDIGRRFNKLEERYETWKSIIERADVNYNKENNKVTATEETWNDIYKDYELGNLYSNDENEHLWDELCGIFGPDSVRIARNAMITPFPESKLGGKRLRETDSEEDSDNEWISIDIDGAEDNEKLDPSHANIRVPKGHVCPYPGDRIMNPSKSKGGTSSSSQTDVKNKKGKAKRFLEF